MRARALAAPHQAVAQDWRARVLSAVVIGAILFNFALCFVNTNLFRTGAGVVIGCEMALIGATLALLVGRNFDLFISRSSSCTIGPLWVSMPLSQALSR